MEVRFSSKSINKQDNHNSVGTGGNDTPGECRFSSGGDILGSKLVDRRSQVQTPIAFFDLAVRLFVGVKANCLTRDVGL